MVKERCIIYGTVIAYDSETIRRAIIVFFLPSRITLCCKVLTYCGNAPRGKPHIKEPAFST